MELSKISKSESNLGERDSSVFDKKIINHSLNNFLFMISKKFPQKSIGTVLIMSIKNPQNFLGKGKEGTAYKIDKISKYVVKMPNNYNLKENIKEDFIELKDEFPLNNFGQAVAINSDNIQILKRVKGNPHGPLMNKIEKQNDKLFLEDAIMAFKQIINISKFSIKSYIDLAQQINVINKHPNFCVDMLNSNNLIVDNKKQKLRLIDLFNKNKNPILEDFKGDVHSMINLILCALDHSEIYSFLNDLQREELKTSVKEVVNKCILASNLVKLSLSKVNPEELYDGILDFIFHMKGLPTKKFLSDKYRQFRNLYPNIIPEVRKSKIILDKRKFCEKIKSRINVSDTIRPYYLIYLHQRKLLSGSDVSEIIKLFLNKIPQKDLIYFIQLNIIKIDDNNTVKSLCENNLLKKKIIEST